MSTRPVSPVRAITGIVLIFLALFPAWGGAAILWVYLPRGDWETASLGLTVWALAVILALGGYLLTRKGTRG